MSARLPLVWGVVVAALLYVAVVEVGAQRQGGISQTGRFDLGLVPPAPQDSPMTQKQAELKHMNEDDCGAHCGEVGIVIPGEGYETPKGHIDGYEDCNGNPWCGTWGEWEATYNP